MEKDEAITKVTVISRGVRLQTITGDEVRKKYRYPLVDIEPSDEEMMLHKLLDEFLCNVCKNWMHSSDFVTMLESNKGTEFRVCFACEFHCS